MRFRTLTLSLSLTVAAASALLAAVEPFATRESVATAAQDATTKLQALRELNQGDTVFLQALAGDATFAKRLFALIRANDRTGAQGLIQGKYSDSTVQIFRLESDFQISWARRNRKGGCVTFCFSSENDCTASDGSTGNNMVRDTTTKSCEAAGITL